MQLKLIQTLLNTFLLMKASHHSDFYLKFSKYIQQLKMKYSNPWMDH